MNCTRCTRPIQGSVTLVKAGRPLNKTEVVIPLDCYTNGKFCQKEDTRVAYLERTGVALGVKRSLF